VTEGPVSHECSDNSTDACQLASDGFRALVDKLGIVDAIRYLHLYDPGHNDYTAERQQWLDQVSIDELARLMAEAQARQSAVATP
jgi:hypothetical protein